MRDFSGKQIVICGGASGLGFYFAKEFVKANGEVSVLDLLVPQAPFAEDSLSYFICDVSHYEETFSVLEKIVKEKGKIDVLVNCIRLKGNPTSSFSSCEKGAWDKGLRVNLDTYFNASSAVCELMRNRNDGCSIVNISSISSFLISADQTIDYHCAKAAINQLTRFLAVKYGPYGIRVNAISPGLISHHFPEQASSSSAASLYQKRAQSIPLRRSGGPQDVASLVLFLASELSGFITGQDIVIDGGLSICEQLYLLSAAATENS